LDAPSAETDGKGEMKEERVELFRQLLEVGERYKRVNQYD